MCPMIDEYYTPIMCRDIMASGLGFPFMMNPGMMGMYGAGMYNTNYLGGVSLPAKLNNDTLHIINSKEKENKSQLKTIGKAVLAVVGYMALAAIFKGKAPKSSSKSGSWFNSIGKWFKRKPVTPTPTP